MSGSDKAGVQYWESTYRDRVRRPMNPADASIRAHGRRQLHEYFVGALNDVTVPSSLLEIGCGGSRFLPYFARSFGFTVSGLDYSATGCEQARRVLKEEGVKG